MGKSRVDRLMQEHPELEVEWKGFEIHPETPADGSARRSMPPDRQKAADDHIAAMAREAGVEMSRPDFRTSSHLALVADAFARDQGQVNPFHENMLHAYWTEHRNIGLLEVVLDVAAASGLNAPELRAAIEDGRYEAELAEVYDECNRYGINGVPTFLVGRYMVVGAQPYDVLERALKLAREDETPAEVPGGAAS
ncbi:MAG: DsbA family oxidoreductase [Chloroflexota bacterium]